MCIRDKCIFCWFNPFSWLMKREVRGNLEYMADSRVLETGHDSKSYQYHLLGPVSYTHLDVYKRQGCPPGTDTGCL